MTRPYSNLTRRDRELDAQAMAERAAEVAPALEAATPEHTCGGVPTASCDACWLEHATVRP